MSQGPHHAIVFGASSIIGWALVDQLLGYDPRSASFTKITAVTNRPLDPSESFWPEVDSNRKELQLVSGINLQEGDETTLANALKQTVADIATVTHIYYLVFSAIENDIEEVATNRRMFQNVIQAHASLCPNLEFVVFPGGTRGYGIYSPETTFTPPLTEDMVANLPPKYAETVVYPVYRELLDAASNGKKWTWCEVCPDAIIGFTPNGSQFSLALHWAQYLSLYAYNHGVGPHVKEPSATDVEVPFPGNAAGAKSLFTPVASRTIARFMIYASLNPDKCGNGRLFNVADSQTPCQHGQLWPHLARWFGLVGTGPPEDQVQVEALKVGELPQTTPSLTPGEYVVKYRHEFAECGHDRAIAGGVGAGRQQLDSAGYWLTFDRQMSIKRLREVWDEGDKDPTEAWLDSFEMFRKAGLIL